MDQWSDHGATPIGRWSGTALPIRESCRRYAAAGFTADLEPLRRLMPSALLHPVQVWPGRGLLLLEATEAAWSAAGETLFDVRSILVATAVSVGSGPAKPLEPLGEIFSADGTGGCRAGFLTLRVLVSDADAADFFSEAVGYHDVRRADITCGTTARADWFAGSIDGASAIGLAVRNTGRPGEGRGGSTLISLPGGRLHCSFSRVSGTGYRYAIGTGAASVKVGPHPAGDVIREVPPGRCLGGMTATDHSALMQAWPAPIDEEELA